MSDVLTCAACGAKNRVTTVPAGQVPTCARCGAALPWLIQGTDATFTQDVQAGVPVLVDFWAPWCGPCRVIGPVLEDLARERAGKLKVVKVNVDDHPHAPGQYQVQGIPTLLLFRNGQLAGRQVGAAPKGTLSAWIDAT
ncbi:thioredoxin [Deinococcus sedimenti]|uniref:Thioredoxin n=1 Tax=Deinococcus sedimenti TaxID=1867090 RepID=A0ABQ2S3G3_9DEIO|nr:thioredoxin [Deinococcus sedimenti]GGR92547.1 thiol reductase thioredoxin [Deinococcus sedimenti]